MSNTKTIAITGASGQLGSHVAKALLKNTSNTNTALRFASRDVSKLSAYKDAGHQTIVADFDEAASLLNAFTGADVALIISGDAPNDVRIAQHRRAIDAAKQAGVQRVVYTSFINASPDSKFTFAAIHADTEAYLKASGLQYTILRNGLYSANLSDAITGAWASGQLSGHGTQGKASYISHADLGEAIAAALLNDAHANQTYTLTGAEAVNYADIAALLSSPDQRIDVLEINATDYAAALASYGLPEFLVEAIVSMGDALNANEYAQITQDFATLTGRAPTPLADFVQSLKS